MKIIWTAGKDKDQAKDIVANFRGGGQLRRRLEEIINAKIDSVRIKARQEEGYASPNWAYQQAGYIERERAYLEIISLINDEKE